MKKLIAITAMLALCGCARFSTKQTDTTYADGKPIRSITTKASAGTFWSSSSELAKFKASQTDKTQSATVGTLGQSTSEPTNTLNTIEGVAAAVVSAAIKAAK